MTSNFKTDSATMTRDDAFAAFIEWASSKLDNDPEALSGLRSKKEWIQDAMVYVSWPEQFGSTAGPFGGIGGCAMTTFRMEAWVLNGEHLDEETIAFVFSGGKALGIRKFTGIPTLGEAQ